MSYFDTSEYCAYLYLGNRIRYTILEKTKMSWNRTCDPCYEMIVGGKNNTSDAIPT